MMAKKVKDFDVGTVGAGAGLIKLILMMFLKLQLAMSTMKQVLLS